MTPKQKAKQQKNLTVAHNDYNRGLNSYASFKVSNQVVGEDLVQDTFLKTWKYLAKGGKIDMMKAFLYHILNNLIIDEYRTRKHKTVSLDTLLDRNAEPSTDDFGRLFDMLDGRAALLLIPRLPKLDAKVMRMRYVQGLSLAEISIATGKTQNAIAVQIHRALQKLRILYKKD
jgi:RNA polymerase sigma-70 factor (ECF subfamily)